MSDPPPGMDEATYFDLCRKTMHDSQWTLPEIREACRIKFKWIKAQELIQGLRNSQSTLEEAVIFLLEENFKP